jgi:cysteine desulfurase/selenocysteine lyase
MEKYREDFSLLAKREVIYFDSATATLVPRQVIEALKDFYETNGTIVKRGAYKLTMEATERYDKARAEVAEFFNCRPREIVFVPNESYGISSLLYSLSWKKGNRISTSYLEHHSNYLPLLYLASHFDIKLDYLPQTAEGQINPDGLTELITPDTKLIVLTYSPLLFGTIIPLKTIIKIAHDHQIPVLIDGTRIAGHLPINLRALGCFRLPWECRITGADGDRGFVHQPAASNEVRSVDFGERDGAQGNGEGVSVDGFPG